MGGLRQRRLSGGSVFLWVCRVWRGGDGFGGCVWVACCRNGGLGGVI